MMAEAGWDDDDFSEDAFEQCDILASQVLSGIVNSTTSDSNVLNQRISMNSSVTSYGTNRTNSTLIKRTSSISNQTRGSSNNTMPPPTTVLYNNRIPLQKKGETVSNGSLQLEKQLQQCQRQVSELQKTNMTLTGEISMVRREIDTKQKENEKEAKRKQQEYIEKIRDIQVELDKMKTELDRAKTEIRFKDQEQIALNERLRSFKSVNKNLTRMPSSPLQESPPKRRKISNERVAAFPTMADFGKTEVKQKSSEKAVQYIAEGHQDRTSSVDNHTRCELQKKLIDSLDNINVEKADGELLKDIVVAAAFRVRRILISVNELKSSKRKKRASKPPEELVRKVKSTSNVLLWINELTLTEATRCPVALEKISVRERSKQDKLRVNGLNEEVGELLDLLALLLRARVTEHQGLCSSVVQLATTSIIYVEGVKYNKIFPVMLAVVDILLEEMNNTTGLPIILLMVKLVKELLLNPSHAKELFNHNEGPSTIRNLLRHIVHISKQLTIDKSEKLCWDMMSLAMCDCSCEGVAILVLGSLFLVLGDHLDKWKHQSVVLGIDVAVPVELFSRGIHLCRRLQYKPQMSRIQSQFGPCHSSWLSQIQKLQPMLNLPSKDVAVLLELLKEFEIQPPSEEDMEVDNT